MAIPQTFPELTAYTYLGRSHEPDLKDNRLRRQINRSSTALHTICHLLQRQSDSSPDPKTNQVRIGEASFVLGYRLGDKPDSPDTKEIYAQFQLQFAGGATSTQYFRAHTPSRHCGLGSLSFKAIHINTGIYFFSQTGSSPLASHDQLDNDHDKPTSTPIPEISRGPTLSELEIITRLSSAIAGTVTLILSTQQRDDNDPRININIDVPDFQYHWTACKLLSRNLVDGSYVTEMDGGSTSGTEAAVELIGEWLAMGAEFLSHLDEKFQPSTADDLGRLMYVLKAVKPALGQPRGQ
ncbi:hypothetical protein BBP40_005924 [Aspergillus hancockii]|nr:hypothetical protein BBP40_005924 [Aspergillus hancockii]